ncbi:MAG: proton-conducting transporter membrane subunit [Lachnospiraceae bacterium]|nr:proton-conducting transporter membrane subunit [Lachnospiraceae bacterium]
MNGWILLPVFLPAIAGIILLVSSFCEHLGGEKKKTNLFIKIGAAVKRSGLADSDKIREKNKKKELKRRTQKEGPKENYAGKDQPVMLPSVQRVGRQVSEKSRAIAGKVQVKAKNQLQSQILRTEEERLGIHIFTGIVLIVSALLALIAAWTGDKSVTLFYLMKDIPVYFHIDAIGSLFVTIVTIVWVLAGIYAFVYMEHEGEEKRFFGFYLVVYAVLVALDFSGNLVTMYLFYELMTLTSMPLVLHNGSREAIMAALKYLFYSMCGAYLGLFGIFFLSQYCDTLNFTAGGSLNLALVGEHQTVLLIAVFAMLIGFGAKAGMFPLHAWLPAAHPVAPSPASAVLSGIIVKSGVLAIIRVVYYMVGADFLRGTWVQTAWMTLTLLTVFMGSMLAYREKVLKKRLAYSTVSQISYILFGLSVLSPTAFTGALLHTVCHAFIKTALFLTAGIFMFQCNKTRVDELSGIGKQMPKTLWCYTIVSLGLIGIPPMSGFISKWYLAEGALEAGAGVFGWLGPVILLISAFLTAGYLLPITMKGFFPGKEADGAGIIKKEPSCAMLIPLIIFAALTILLGIFPGPLADYASRIAAAVM